MSVCVFNFRENVFISKALENYSNRWKKHEANFKRFR